MEPTPYQQDTQGVPTHCHCHRCALPYQFAMQSLHSNAALLVAPVSLTSKFVLHAVHQAWQSPQKVFGQTILFCQYPTPASNCLMPRMDFCAWPNLLPAYNSVDVLGSHPLVITTLWNIRALAISQPANVYLLATPLTGSEHVPPLRASRACGVHLPLLVIFAQAMHKALLGDNSSAALTASADKLYWCICTGARMTKGLHICRHLHKAGWRVVLVDYDRWWMQGSRLSACCAAFFTVPDPEQDPVGEVAPTFLLQVDN